MQEIKISFIEPYPQPLLGGELGLTSEDIAGSIGVTHRAFVRDMRDRKYISFLENAGFRFVQFCSNRSGPGRKGKIWVFDTNAAKAVVAASRTEYGAGYLRHLIDCERFVLEGMPKLKALFEQQAKELIEAQAKIAGFEKRRRKVRGKPKTARVHAGYRTVASLFEPEGYREPVFREVPLDQLTDEEARVMEIIHLNRIAEGLNKKATALAEHRREPKPRVVALVPLDADGVKKA